MYKHWRKEISERAKKLFDQMRTQCLSRGHGGIKELAVLFRKIDIDFSKRICYEELRVGLENYGMEISESDLKVLFISFDADENQQIDFAEFLFRLRPPLSPARVKIINEVFRTLDVNGDGAIKTDDLQGKTCIFDDRYIIVVQVPNLHTKLLLKLLRPFTN